MQKKKKNSETRAFKELKPQLGHACHFFWQGYKKKTQVIYIIGMFGTFNTDHFNNEI